MSLSKAVLPGTDEEVLAIGLQKSDPVHRLFDVLAEKLPQHKDVFEEIADSLEEEHLCVTIDSLGGLYWHDVEAAVLAAGGKAGWVKSIQRLAGVTFPVLGKDVPESAALGLPSAVPAQTHATICAAGRASIAAGEQLGARLEREGTLSNLIPPWGRLDAVIVECPDFTKEQLSYQDKKAVNAELWKWLFEQYGFTGTCSLLIKQLAGQLSKRYTVGGAPWKRSLKYRAKNPRRASCVRARPPLATRPCVPLFATRWRLHLLRLLRRVQFSQRCRPWRRLQSHSQKQFLGLSAEESHGGAPPPNWPTAECLCC